MPCEEWLILASRSILFPSSVWHRLAILSLCMLSGTGVRYPILQQTGWGSIASVALGCARSASARSAALRRRHTARARNIHRPSHRNKCTGDPLTSRMLDTLYQCFSLGCSWNVQYLCTFWFPSISASRRKSWCRASSAADSRVIPDSPHHPWQRRFTTCEHEMTWHKIVCLNESRTIITLTSLFAIDTSIANRTCISVICNWCTSQNHHSHQLFRMLCGWPCRTLLLIKQQLAFH